MYVSFPHQLSKEKSGWWFQTFFIFFSLPGEKQIQFDEHIFQNGLNQTTQYIHVRYTNMLQYMWGFPPFFRPKRPSGGTEVLVLFGIKEPSEVHDHRLKRGGV